MEGLSKLFFMLKVGIDIVEYDHTKYCQYR